MKKKEYIKLLEWYDKNYCNTLFDRPDLEKVVDEYLNKQEKIPEEVFQIILNDLSERKQSARLLKVNEERRKLIKKVTQEGYEINDFFEVNRCMVKKWAQDPKMKDHLTPETLYAKANFTKYRELAEEEEFKPASDRIRNTTEEALKQVRNDLKS